MGKVIITLKKKLITIDQFNKCSFIFQQTRPIECAQHNSFESSIMSLQVVYCSIMHSIHKFLRNFQHYTGFVYYFFSILVDVQLPSSIVVTLS